MSKLISAPSTYAILLLLATAAVHCANLADGSASSGAQLKTSEEIDKDLEEPQDSRSSPLAPLPALVLPSGKVAWFTKSVYGNGDKRNPGMYSFGLGKRSSKERNVGPYSFGLGKRTLPPGSYSFGLGKRNKDLDDDYWRRYARSSRFGFGLGKRSELVEDPLADEYEQVDNIVADDYSDLISRADEVEPEKRTGIRPDGTFYPMPRSSRPMKFRDQHSDSFPLLGKRLPVYNFGLGK